MSDGVEVEIVGTDSSIEVTETATTIDISEDITSVVSSGTNIEVNIAPQITNLEVANKITEVHITPTITEIEVRGISIATSNASGIAVSHDGDSWLNGITTTVQNSIDQLAENPWRFNAGGQNEFIGPRDRFYFNTTNGVTTSLLTGNNTGINIELTPIFEVPGVSSFSSDTAASQTADIIYNQYGQITGTITQDISISTSQVVNLVATISSLSAAIVSVAAQDSAGLNTRINSLSSSLSADLSSINTRLNTVSSAASANEAAILTNSAAIVSANTRLNTVSSAASANEAAILTNSAAIVSANTRIDTVSSAASANEAAILTNSAAIVSANTRIDTVSSAASANEAAIATNSAAIVSANTRIDTVSSAVSANEAAILANEASILTNSAAIVSANTRINTVSSALIVSSGVVGQLFATLSSENSATQAALTSRIDTVSSVAAAALSASGGTISGNLIVSGDLTVSGSTVQLNAEVLNVEDNTIFLNNTASAITSNCSGLAIFRGTGVDDAEFIFNNTTSSWTLSNYIQLDKVLDSDGSAGTTDQFLSRSSDGTTKWASVVTDLSGVNTRINTNSAAIVSANTRINTVSSGVSANQASITALSSRVTSVCSAAIATIARVNAIEASASDNEAAIVSANHRIDTNSSGLVSANTRIDTVSSGVSANQAAIAALETAPVLINVKNTHSGTVTKGTPVYITGSVGASGRVEVQPADSSNSSKMPAVGLLEQDLDTDGEGHVVVTGILSHFNTSSVDGTSAVNNSGDTLYVKSGGGLTITRPTDSTTFVQNMGKIGRDHNNTGNLIVSSIMRANDVPNLEQGKFWIGNSGANPTSFSSVLQSRLAEGSLSAELTSLRCTGSVIFDEGLTVDTDTIFVNNNQNKVGINTNNPTETLDIVGDLQASGGLQIGLNNNAAAKSVCIGTDNSTGGSGNLAVGQDLEINGIRNVGFGYGITIANTQAYNFVVGNQHILGSINQGNFVAGEQNELQGAKFNLIVGGFNYIDSATVIARTSENNILSGNSNRVDSALYSVVAGQSNSSVKTNNIVLMGLSNTASSVNNALMAGKGNSTQSSSNTLVAGKANSALNSDQSAVLGELNNVTADWSVVSGYSNTVSSTNNSFIAGAGNTIRSCSNSVVTGKANTADTANQSTVLGQLNNVTADWAVVGGYNNSVSANNSVVMGQENNVQGGFHSVAGFNNTAKNSFNLVAGTNNFALRDSSIVAGDGNTADGKHCLAVGLGVTVGTSDDWFSVATGYKSIATGTASFAGGIEGDGNIASSALAKASFTYGKATRVFGNAENSQAMGAYAEVGHANPVNNQTANQATAIGYNTSATNDNCIAAGNTSVTEGETSFAFGQTCRTHPNAAYSFVHGFECQTGESPNSGNLEAKHSTAIGYKSRAYKNNSFAGGNTSFAFGDTSFAFGNGAVASNGFSNIALGQGITTATDSSSADSDSQVAVGKYNEHAYSGTVPQMFAVGTGTGDGARYTSMYVGPRSSANANIVMKALKDTAEYSDDTAAGNAGVPIGGLYRTGSIVKIRMS